MEPNGFRQWALHASAASVVGLIGLAVSLVPVASAQASLACGAEITANTAISEDLFCESGDGLTITRDAITLDLKGHTIFSTAGAAIRIAYNVNNVTVQNGVVGGSYGIVADSGTGNHITKLRIVAANFGILLANASATLVDKNVVSSPYRDGIKVDGSNNTIRQNTVTDSVWGITVSNGTAGNVVTQNVLTGNQDYGVGVFDGPSLTTITRNSVTGGRYGIDVHGQASGTTVAQNTVSGAWEDGIKVAAGSIDTLVTQNTSYGNGDDGIDVGSAATAITKNTAYSNTDAGIVAVAGVTDGGGNTAYDNGSPCVEVVCSPGWQ